jgi:hypothetical protein
MSHVTRTLPVSACVLSALFGAGALIASPPAAARELTKAEVKEVVVAAMPELRRCGISLKASTVTASWLIEADGSVSRVSFEDKKLDPGVRRCLHKRIAALDFPISDKRMPVTFPIKLGHGKHGAIAATSSGKLTKKDLDGLLQSVEADLRKCGEGVAQTRFIIQQNGTVGDVVVDDVDEKTGECVRKKVTRLRFPAPARPLDVRRTFTLAEG